MFKLTTFAAAAVLAAGCGPSPAASSTAGTGGAGGAPSSSSSGAAGGASAMCQGMEIPKADLPTSPDGRSAVVACSGQSLSVSVLDPAIVRLAYDLQAKVRPSYAALPQQPAGAPPVIGGTADKAIVCTEELWIEVDRKDCRVRAADKSGAVLLESPEGGGGVKVDGDQRVVRWSAPPDEHYYGFGERTGSLDKRGRTMLFYDTDAFDPKFGGFPPDADPVYASIPFFVGLRGGRAHGFFFDVTHRLTFDMAAQDKTAWSVTAAGGNVDQYLFAGPSIASVLERYTRLTGRMPLPPQWTLGFHQSKWGYSPDTKVIEVATELRNRNIPADAMWLDIQHMDGFRSFTWDPVSFPDPAGLVKTLASQGFRTVAIVDPGIKIDPMWDVYDEGLQKGYFMKGPDGMPFQGAVWPGPAVFPDFSDPAVRAFWGSLVPRTLDKGVRGLWIDMNEPSSFGAKKGGTVPDTLSTAGDGFPSTMAEMHNVYALNEAHATYDGMRAAAPDQRPFILTRAGYAGIQRYAAMWTGDAPSSWDTLRGTLPELLGMGLSGLTFAGSDVGGFSGGPTPELYARWMQVGALSPFFRAHTSLAAGSQEPWQFGIEVTDVSRAVIEERYRLMPYLYSLFYQASQTGAPVLRPLVYEAQDDAKTYDLDDEAMLGPYVLYAPVLSEGAQTRHVYLPKGRWFEAASGAIHEGPASFDEDVVLGALPTYVREGAIVPRRDLVQHTDEKPIQTLTLDVYPSEQPTSFALYEDDGHSFAFEKGERAITTYSTQRTAKGATLSASARDGSFKPAARSLVIRVRRVDHAPSAVTLDGAPLQALDTEDAFNAATQGYWYDARDLSILVRLPDPGKFDLSLDYDPSISDPAPPVMMDFEVTVPDGTPQDKPVCIASSANGWTHAPLPWKSATTAGGLVSVPRGKYLFYKYTRGDWSTVEKWPGCVEATNRYELGKAHPVKADTVWAWADKCP
jgi:alpha-glucosidase